MKRRMVAVKPKRAKEKGKRQRGESVRRAKERLMLPLQLSADALKSQMRVTLLGRDAALIENHGGVIELGSECVKIAQSRRLLSRRGVDASPVCVLGNGLYIERCGREALLVRGRIDGVTLSGVRQ